MLDRPKLGIILNPIAGRGRALNLQIPLVNYLRRRNILFQLERSNRPGHATELSSQMSKEFDIIVAMGGDGTLNEVAAGVYGSMASLAILPIGSGNDFNRIKVRQKRECPDQEPWHGQERPASAYLH